MILASDAVISTPLRHAAIRVAAKTVGAWRENGADLRGRAGSVLALVLETGVQGGGVALMLGKVYAVAQ